MAYVKVLVFKGTQIWHIPMFSVARINQFQIRSLNFITRDVSGVGLSSQMFKCCKCECQFPGAKFRDTRDEMLKIGLCDLAEASVPLIPLSFLGEHTSTTNQRHLFQAKLPWRGLPKIKSISEWSTFDKMVTSSLSSPGLLCFMQNNQQPATSTGGKMRREMGRIMAGFRPKRARLKDLQRPGTGMTVGKRLASLLSWSNKVTERQRGNLQFVSSAKLPQAVTARSAKRSHEAGWSVGVDVWRSCWLSISKPALWSQGENLQITWSRDVTKWDLTWHNTSWADRVG